MDKISAVLAAKINKLATIKLSELTGRQPKLVKTANFAMNTLSSEFMDDEGRPVDLNFTMIGDQKMDEQEMIAALSSLPPEAIQDAINMYRAAKSEDKMYKQMSGAGIGGGVGYLAGKALSNSNLIAKLSPLLKKIVTPAGITIGGGLLGGILGNAYHNTGRGEINLTNMSLPQYSN